MAATSAGILLHRRDRGPLEVLLVHPGGPFWARKDEGAWSIPKGEYDTDEEPSVAARREFAEELGVAVPDGEERDLGEIRQKGGKRVRAFAVEGVIDTGDIASNTFEMEWPPKSGRTREFPEIDRAGWFGLDEARGKMIPAQTELLDRLVTALG